MLLHIIAIPFRLVFELIKALIITPMVLIIALAILIFGCAIFAVPGAMSSIQLPGFITDLTTRVQRLTAGGTQVTQVTCAARGKGIVVQWSVNNSAEVKWYEVMRKGVQEMAWQRIALVQAGKGATGLYEYTDTALAHGATYQYGIIVVKADGSDTEMAVSSVQVVAP